MPLSAGDKLGFYEILAPIGAGGMGEIYRARDPRLRRDIAIKVLPETIASGGAWERFEREARAASALNHPNICAVYDVGEAAGRPFLVMELLEGETLGVYIGGKPVETAAAMALARQIVDALEAAHSKGILHRDIKPGNIIVNARLHIKVLDFGLAKQMAATETDDTLTLESLTAAGTVVGTPHYMAPEILQGQPADARADLWAFGVVLYEMLSGRRPFHGPTMFEVSSAILREPAPALPASVPDGLRAIVNRCLAKKPEHRFQNATQIRSELEALQSGAAHKFGTDRGKRWLWAVVAAIVLLAAGLMWQVSRSKQPPSTAFKPSSNQEANANFALAMQFQRGQNDIPKAQELLERTLALDSHFAEALRYHAFNYAIEILNGYVNDTNLLYRAEEELGRAAQEEPGLDDVHTALAAVYLMQGRKELVPGQLELALVRNPLTDEALLWREIYYWQNEEHAQVKELARGLLDRAPLLMPARMFLSDTLRTEGDLAGAIVEQQRILEQAPLNISGVSLLNLSYLDRNQLGNAEALLEEKRPAFAGNFMWREARALLLAVRGKRKEALQTMDQETLKFAAAAFPSTLGAAEFYAVLGDNSKAIEWLERAYRNGDERADWFRRDPRLASIRQDPRFQVIINSIEARRKQRQQK
jgi:serine/threonine protein kinase